MDRTLTSPLPRLRAVGAGILLQVAASAACAASVTADTPLLEVWVPGSMHTVSDHPDKKLNPLLNPRTSPPPFKEGNAVTSQCSVLMYATGIVDRASFEAIQQAGRDASKDRQVWQFNQTRLQAQSKVVDGTIARSTRDAQPVGRRPTGREDAGTPPPSRGDAQPRSSDTAPMQRQGGLPRVTAGGLMGMLGLKPAQPTPAPGALPSMPKPSDIRAFMTDFDKLHQQLQHNEAVLAAQDERLRNREQQYARALTELYARALEQLPAGPGQPLPLAQLNDFEKFRAYQVEQCIAARSLPDAATRAQLDSLFDRYQPIATASIAAARPEVLRDLNAANSSSAYRQAWAGHFGTLWLGSVAEKDPELSRSAAARLNTLLAQEQRAREEAERRAAAESARQAALLKQRNLDNAARNAAPTEQEVTRLATTYYMGNTASAGNIGGLMRTSDNTFEQQVDNLFFGRQRIFNVTVKVSELRCQPKGRVQACSAAVNKSLSRLREGQPDRELFNNTSTIEAEYQWNGDGLEAPALREEMGYIVRVSGGGGGGGSSKAADRERDDFNRGMSRRSAAMSGDSYDGQSNRELRREFGYGK